MPLNERLIPQLIVVIPLLVVLAFTATITYYYLEKLEEHALHEGERFYKLYVESEKQERALWLRQLNEQLNYAEEQLEVDAIRDLDQRLADALGIALEFYAKYGTASDDPKVKTQIAELFSSFGKSTDFWLLDAEGHVVVDSAHVDYALLEKISDRMQGGSTSGMMSYRQEGRFGVYTRFEPYGWIVGFGTDLVSERMRLEANMLNMIRQIPGDESGFIALYKEEAPLYLSKDARHALSGLSLAPILSSRDASIVWQTVPDQKMMLAGFYYAPFGWHIVYSLNARMVDMNFAMHRQMLQHEIEHEETLILIASALMWIAFSALSVLLSNQVNRLFNRYREEVRKREDALNDFSEFLEERVKKELDERREKEKMMIQQSKMAAMGDMLGMIAHQWRQPLSQLSYLFMNIEAAFERGELDRKYLDTKMDEGTKLLEFMSHTIDDFRHFFSPDKERERVGVDEVIEQATGLIGKSLEAAGIGLRVHYGAKSPLFVYRNELIQVLLNLLANARDVLAERNVSEPRILVTTREEEEYAILDVNDNGGGVAADVAERMFEPYFTTKHSAQGTGLGLYMARSIVETHLHGKMLFENTSSGATFSILLPIDHTS